MKNYGCISTYAQERAFELLEAYHDYIFHCSHINCHDAYTTIVKQPASRFFVSEERASVVMSRIDKGDRLSRMLPLKREMFFELHKRYRMLKQLHPDWNMTRLMTNIVAQPAPQFYISPVTARLEVTKYKALWHQKKMARITRSL